MASVNYATQFFDAFLRRTLDRAYLSELQAVRLAGFALAQARFESADFTSNVFKSNLNPIGYKYFSASLWQSGPGTTSPEGDKYARFPSIDNAAFELADWIKRRKSAFINADTLGEYVHSMKVSGYFGDSEANYFNGLSVYYDPPDLEGFSAEAPDVVEKVASTVKVLPFSWWLMVAGLAGVAVFFFGSFRSLIRAFKGLF